MHDTEIGAGGEDWDVLLSFLPPDWQELARDTGALKPDLAAAYFIRGVEKGELGRHEEAIADWDAAIRLKPDLAYAYYNRGLSKGKLGRYDEAISDWDAAIRLKPGDAEAYAGRGAAKHGLRRYEEAIADYNQASRLETETPKGSE